ncbi:MAG: hypothetical protein EOS26_27420 [Mesorhizobium sp.]|nr:MAG: hypothetical protein EOS26_27420 [Mesorhizobium sp.]
MIGVQHEPGKVIYALIARNGKHIGSAAITFPRVISVRFRQHIEANTGAESAQYAHQGRRHLATAGHNRRRPHLRGEEKLRL